MSPHLRREAPGDAAAIEAITIAAFLDAPHTGHTEQFIVRALRDAGQLSVSLVAEHDGVIVGHVAISPVTVSDGATNWFGLGPVSVAPPHQGRGIGSRLVTQALTELRLRGAAGCVVLGEPGYYGRFGFRAVPQLVLPGVPPEYFQALWFRDQLPSGNVAYHASFDARE
jgi:putative acetyltransferase